MYYIDIDISKFKHNCAVIDDSGEIITLSWSFTNDSEGFSPLSIYVSVSVQYVLIMPLSIAMLVYILQGVISENYPYNNSAF